MISARVLIRYAPPPKLLGGALPDITDRRIVVQRHGFMSKEAYDVYREAVSSLRFDTASKLHVATIDKLPSVLKRLRAAEIPSVVAPEITSLLETHEATVWLDLQAAQERLSILAREMAKSGKALYSYQTTGVQWLTVRHRALLGDEPGLGKSVQTLCALPANAPVLVVCPSIAKGVWIREAGLWRPTLSPQSLEGRTSFRWPKPGEMIITNFDILPRCHKPTCKKKTVVKCDGCSPILPEAHGPNCPKKTTSCSGCLPLPGKATKGTVMIVDEAHNVRNRTSLRGESVRVLGLEVRKDEGRTWYLTGTPILNNPEELWNLLESCDLAHEAFGSWKNFVRCFQGKVKTIEIYDKRLRRKVSKQIGYEWGTPDEDTIERLQRVMLRRMQRDVLKDLPELTQRLLPVDVSKASLKEFDRLFRELGGGKGIAEILARKKIPFELVSTVRSALSKAKIPAMLEYVEEFEGNAEPLLVFSAHRSPIDLFLERPGWAVITGDTPARERTKIEDAFQAGKYLGLAGTIEAAGVGITLTHACHGLFVDWAWTPALNEQAMRRMLRHGQKRAVFVDILVANHALDQRVAEILLGKKTIIEGSVDAASEREGAA